MSEFSNPSQSLVKELDPIQLGGDLEVVQHEADLFLSQADEDLRAALAGRAPAGHTETVISTQQGAGGLFEYAAAVALGRPDSRTTTEYVRDALVAPAYKRTREALMGRPEYLAQGASIQANVPRFARIAKSVQRDMFGDIPHNSVDLDPSAWILNEINGRKFGDTIDNPEAAKPLTETNADELVALLPALLAVSEYKMAQWHARTVALASTVALLEHVAVEYPEKAATVDLTATTEALALMLSAARIDKGKHDHYGRETAKWLEPSCNAILERIVRIKAQQRMLVDQNAS